MPDNFLGHNLDFFHLLCGFGFLFLSVISYRLDQNAGRRAPLFWMIHFGIFSAAVEFLEIFILAFNGVDYLHLKLFLVICSCFSLMQFSRNAFSRFISKDPGAWIYIPLLAAPLYKAIRGPVELALAIMGLEYLLAGFFASSALYLIYKKNGNEKLKPLVAYFFLVLFIMSFKLIAPEFLPPDVFGLRSALKNSTIPTVFLMFIAGLFTTWSLGKYYVSQKSINEHLQELTSKENSRYIFIFIAVMIVFTGWILTGYVEKSFKTTESENLLKRTRLVASSISREALESLKWNAEDAGDPHYIYIKNMLISFRNANKDCRFISLMGYRGGKVYILADSEPGSSPDYSPPGQVYEEINQENILFFSQKKKEDMTGPSYDRWGEWVSTLVSVPLFKETTEHVAVVMDLDAQNWRYAVAKRRLAPIGIVALLLLLVLIFYADRERQIFRTARLLNLRRAQYEIISGTGSDFNESIEKITKKTASVIGVERVGVWLYNSDGSAIVCKKLFIKSSRSYENGRKLIAADFPAYFKAITEHRNIAVDNAANDPGVIEFVSSYCMPLGITSMLDSPIWREGKIIGVLCIEHTGIPRKWSDDEIAFAGVVADAVAIALETSERAAAEKVKIESERKYKILFDNSPLGIMYADETGRVLNINNALTSILGPEASSELKKSGVNGFRHFTGSCFAKCFRECAASLKEDFGEFEYSCDEQRRYFLEYHIKPVKESDGKVSIQVVMEDITVKRHMQDEMEKVSKLESLGILAGGIAHDFNNYLTAIVGNISYAKLINGNRDNELFEVLDKAEKITFDAKDLTLQLLTFSKGNRPVKKIFHINSSIRETVDFVLCGTNIQCVWKCAGDSWPIEADEGQIKQAFTNIVVNAVQAMPKGGKISIGIENVRTSEGEVAGLKAGHFVKISINDTGCGISETDIKKIFDPYYTTKPHGSGLGLAVVFSVIKNHEGAIFVESDGHSGAAFIVFLPAAPESRIESVPSKNHGPGVKSFGKVLLMDDEDEIRSITGQLLTYYGFTVETADCGENAIELFTRAKSDGSAFDALVMDLTIPGGMGGADALKKILEIDPDVKAIAASGYFNENTTDRDYKHFGFKVFITKPYKIKELCMILKNVIAGDQTS